ncbi:MAG: YkgJ family cysteine cluster protein [Arenicella sp.]|nr:YkgJ family cysteine cluster protein [Arenicella sp.]
MSKVNKSCSNCAASCCRFEVFLITDTGVPEEHIYTDDDGMQTMLRLDDGWCSALNRETMNCSIYEFRPWLCREFDMGSIDCLETWQAKP